MVYSDMAIEESQGPLLSYDSDACHGFLGRPNQRRLGSSAAELVVAQSCDFDAPEDVEPCWAVLLEERNSVLSPGF